jgi:hypothetical protein
LPSIRVYAGDGAYSGNKKQKTGKNRGLKGEIWEIYGFSFGKQQALGTLKRLREPTAEGGFLTAGKKEGDVVQFVNNSRNWGRDSARSAEGPRRGGTKYSMRVVA